MKVQLVNRDGTEIDLTEYMQPVTFHIERRPYWTTMQDVVRDEQMNARLRAVTRLIGLRLSASIFGSGEASEAWVQSQLTDEERAILAKEAERVECRALPEPRTE